MNEQQARFLNSYGRCRLEKCMCIDPHTPRFKGAWGGLACPDWVPLGAEDIKELIDHAKANYRKVDNDVKVQA